MQMKQFLKRLRIQFLIRFKFKLRKVGKGFYCGYNIRTSKNAITIGNYVYIGNNCTLTVKELSIGDFTMLASNVAVVGGDHNFGEIGIPIRNTGYSERKGVVIGKDCWIGHGVIILDGVSIGDCCVIGAGSVVTKNISPFSIAVGNPAKVIRKRIDEKYWSNHVEKISQINIF